MRALFIFTAVFCGALDLLSCDKSCAVSSLTSTSQICSKAAQKKTSKGSKTPKKSGDSKEKRCTKKCCDNNNNKEENPKKSGESRGNPENFGENIVIKTQGSFFVGGSTVKKAGVYNPKLWMNQQGQTRHGDHAYIFYQIPPKARKYAILFIHGAGQSGKCWESTPDGREGFQNLFLRHGYPVFIMDQPRMGRAGAALHDGIVKVANLDQFLFDINRLGVWPKFYDGVQFPRDEESLKQFYSQITPNTGGYNNSVIVEAICRGVDSIENIMKKEKLDIAGIVLVTHSQSCCPGWYAAMKSEKIKAIVAMEPASGLPFPEKRWPGTIRSSSGVLKTNKVQNNEFLSLTKLPIVLYFGDNIPNKDNKILGQDNWYQRLKMAKQWACLINTNGGKAQVVHLPNIGIYGNTHFMFMDKNNKKIAKLIFEWMEKLERQ